MKAVFIDRDGTIGGGDDVTLPKNFELFPFSGLAFSLLKEHGFYLIAFTNQPDISRGVASVGEFESELRSFGFNDVCICPHRPDERCKCRKPSTYMLDVMTEKYSLVRSDCYVIGDRWSDMLAGIHAGMNSILVMTGAGQTALNENSGQWEPDKAVYLARNLFDAAKWITAAK